MDHTRRLSTRSNSFKLMSVGSSTPIRSTGVCSRSKTGLLLLHLKFVSAAPAPKSETMMSSLLESDSAPRADLNGTIGALLAELGLGWMISHRRRHGDDPSALRPVILDALVEKLISDNAETKERVRRLESSMQGVPYVRDEEFTRVVEAISKKCNSLVGSIAGVEMDAAAAMAPVLAELTDLQAELIALRKENDELKARVDGTAALVRSHEPALTPQQLSKQAAIPPRPKTRKRTRGDDNEAADAPAANRAAVMRDLTSLF